MKVKKPKALDGRYRLRNSLMCYETMLYKLRQLFKRSQFEKIEKDKQTEYTNKDTTHFKNVGLEFFDRFLNSLFFFKNDTTLKRYNILV